MRQESIKILEENIGNNLFVIGHSNFFQDSSPKARDTKAKINFWDFIKMKNFCTAKETVTKTKRQPMEWENIFANDSTDKRLTSRIYKDLKLNTHKTDKDTIKKRGRWTFFHVSDSHLYVFIGEVSVHIFCPFFNMILSALCVLSLSSL